MMPNVLGSTIQIKATSELKLKQVLWVQNLSHISLNETCNFSVDQENGWTTAAAAVREV
jgi:hypothetical protein